MENIKDLYYMSANMDMTTHIRVYEDGDCVWHGLYRDMPADIKDRKVAVFDFDNDLAGCLVTIIPA